MSGCFLFFRFWPGFDFDQFPVDRFNGIADEDLPAALACYAGEEIRRPEVRHRIKEVVKARRQKLIAGIRKQSASRMMVGARDVGVRKRLTKRDWYWPRIRRAERGDLLVCRLGAYLGWWQKGEAWSESLPFGPQVWFSRVSSPELAEAFVSHLNGRTGLDYDGNEVELHFRPRFGFVEDADTALQISAQRCINAIGRGQAPDVRGSKAALAMGQKAMAIADEMLEATAPPTPVQAVSTPPAPDPESQTPAANPLEAEHGGGDAEGQVESSNGKEERRGRVGAIPAGSDVAPQTPCGNPSNKEADTAPNEKSYYVSQVRTLTGYSNDSLNRYAKAAGVRTAGRGSREFRWTQDEVVMILRHIKACNISQDKRPRVETLLKELTKEPPETRK